MAVSGLVPTVMIVDPHLISREGTRALFASCPDARLVADTGDGNHALALCTEHAPDVVVIDVDVRDPGAPQLAYRLKTMERPPAIVAWSGSAVAANIDDMFSAGASAFVLRDRGFGRMVEAITAVAAGEVVIDVYATGGRSASSARGYRPSPGSLSTRELQTLQLMASGLSTKQIAQSLKLSPKTVETYRAHIYAKLNIDSLVTLTKYAIRHGLATIE